MFDSEPTSQTSASSPGYDQISIVSTVGLGAARRQTCLPGGDAHGEPAAGGLLATGRAPLKRAFDLVASISALALLSPVFALIGAAVALESRGPILFRQRRTGLNGRVFTIYKFRSMTVEEDDHTVSHATVDDPRVTRVGAFIRSTSLDELPQLFNILKGDMAIVGPRPHALAHDAHYAALLSRYGERFAVRPGVTGLAQVQGLRGGINTLECMARRVDADIEYVTNRSFFGDIVIILRTIPLLLRRVNAY